MAQPGNHRDVQPLRLLPKLIALGFQFGCSGVHRPVVCIGLGGLDAQPVAFVGHGPGEGPEPLSILKQGVVLATQLVQLGQ